MDKQPSAQAFVAATSFLALFSIVGLALYGLPFYYDFMVKDFGWSRTQVTSGNAISKLIVGPLFGFIAGWLVDSFGPRRLMLTGVVMAGGALIGLSVMSALWMFYLFYHVGFIVLICMAVIGAGAVALLPKRKVEINLHPLSGSQAGELA